ncbi:MAG TPA: pitrilysin family protein [Longimicrobiales bacterium]|nr:pitrilysin family protein [Longimicrobiales bacterium]
MSTRHAPTPPEPGPVRAFDFPVIHDDRIGDAGLRVLTASHGDLPLVTAHLVLDAGAGAEPEGLDGVARLTANAMEAGTRKRNADQLAWALESLGVELDTGTGWDAGHLAITVPTDRLEDALALFAEIVRRPAFPADQIERLREEQLAGILQRRKEPRALGDDMAARYIFAEGMPYGRPVVGREATVRGLGADHVAAFYEARYRPGSGALVFTGDITAERAAGLARSHFGDWNSGAAQPARVPVQPRVDTTTIFVVDRPGSVQSEIRIGDVGVERAHPDFFPLIVFNTILGGAFTSRLNMNLRERHGFTYGVNSGFAFRRQPGPFSISAAVATDVTARAVEEALSEMRGLHDGGATAQELDAARDYLRGVLPLTLQTTDQLAGRVAEIVVFDLPIDYFVQYRDHIADVTADDVARVARDRLRLSRLAIVVVGDAEQITKPLQDLGIGPVQVVDGP